MPSQIAPDESSEPDGEDKHDSPCLAHTPTIPQFPAGFGQETPIGRAVSAIGEKSINTRMDPSRVTSVGIKSLQARRPLRPTERQPTEGDPKTDGEVKSKGKKSLYTKQGTIAASVETAKVQKYSSIEATGTKSLSPAAKKTLKPILHSNATSLPIADYSNAAFPTYGTGGLVHHADEDEFFADVKDIPRLSGARSEIIQKPGSRVASVNSTVESISTGTSLKKGIIKTSPTVMSMSPEKHLTRAGSTLEENQAKESLKDGVQFRDLSSKKKLGARSQTTMLEKSNLNSTEKSEEAKPASYRSISAAGFGVSLGTSGDLAENRESNGTHGTVGTTATIGPIGQKKENSSIYQSVKPPHTTSFAQLVEHTYTQVVTGNVKVIDDLGNNFDAASTMNMHKSMKSSVTKSDLSSDLGGSKKFEEEDDNEEETIEGEGVDDSVSYNRSKSCRNLRGATTNMEDREYTTMENITSGRYSQFSLFQFAIAFTIFVNSLWLAFETDMLNDDNKMFFYAGECVFVVVFMVEIIGRLRWWGSYIFFFGPRDESMWNIFDFTIVVYAVFDLVLSTMVLFDLSSGDLDAGGQVATLLRLIKIGRLARLIRLLRFFKQVWLLIQGLSEALRFLCWVWILLIIIIYVFAVFLTKILGQTEAALEQDFGQVPRSMLTLFQILTTEGWGDIARRTTRKRPLAVFVILIFMTVTTFAMVNVVVAVIVNSTLENSASLKDDLIKKAKIERLTAMKRFYGVFQKIDVDGDGFLSREEFMAGAELPEIAGLMSDVGIDTNDVSALFDIIDKDESGVLSPEEFCAGLLRARTNASGRDLLELQCDIWKITRQREDTADELFQELLFRVQRCQIAIDALIIENAQTKRRHNEAAVKFNLKRKEIAQQNKLKRMSSRSYGMHPSGMLGGPVGSPLGSPGTYYPAVPRGSLTNSPALPKGSFMNAPAQKQSSANSPDPSQNRNSTRNHSQSPGQQKALENNAAPLQRTIVDDWSSDSDDYIMGGKSEKC